MFKQAENDSQDMDVSRNAIYCLGMHESPFPSGNSMVEAYLKLLDSFCFTFVKNKIMLSQLVINRQ